MNQFLFSVLYVAKLTINNAFSLFKSSIALARGAELHLSPMLMAALNQFEADTERFGAQINLNLKSNLTDDLKPMDKERNILFGMIKHAVITYMESSNGAKKAAAKLMHLFLAPYWNTGDLPMNTETNILNEILEKYHLSPELMAAALALDVQGTFTSMESINTEYKTIYDDRTTEFAERAKESGSSLKPAATAGYVQFCTALEQAVNLMPTPALILLFNKMDELRKTSHLLEPPPKPKPKPPVDPTTTPVA